MEIVIGLIMILFFIMAIILSIKYKFKQFKCFKYANKMLNKGNAFQTFLVTLGSHVGTGNIVGVSSAIMIGGSGTIFWIIIYTMFSSIYSLLENTLSIKSRIYDNEYRSSSSSYMKKYLNLKIIPIVFSLILICTNTILFQPIQINTIATSISSIFDIKIIIIYFVLLIFTFIFIFRGTKRIVQAEEGIVPIMIGLYFVVGIVAIIVNFRRIPMLVVDILKNAFLIESISGGGIFIVITTAFKRTMFSNEAGLGTIPSISGMSNVDNPLDQAYVQTFGVFIDMFICVMTGFMILLYSTTGESCVEIIISLFTNMFGVFGKYLGLFFMITFSLATVISQYYIGETNLFYLVKNKKGYRMLLKLLFVLGITLGCFMETSKLFKIIDFTLVILGLINITCIILIDCKSNDLKDLIIEKK